MILHDTVQCVFFGYGHAFFYSLKLFSYKADNCNTQQSFRIEHQPLKSVYSYVYVVLNQLILIQ